MVVRTEAADQNCHNQRATCQTEFNGLRHTWDSDRNRADQHSEENTKEDRNQIGLAQTTHRVTERLSHCVDSHLRSNNGQAVANLQFEVMLGNQIDTRTIDTCNIHRITTTQTQLTNGLAIDMGLGDDNSARYKLLVEVKPIGVLHIDLMTEHHLNRLDIFACADNQHLVILSQHRIGISDLDSAVCSADTRHYKRAIDQSASLLHRASEQIGIGQLDRNFRSIFRLI